MLDWLKGLFSAAEDEAGAVVGTIEDEIHYPLWPIARYQMVVSPRLIRGAWPTLQDLYGLQRMGVHATINLCAERRHDQLVEKAGLEPYNIPIRDNAPPTTTQFAAFLQLVRDHAPVYVHCEEGKGRTGCMVAGYRVLEEGWDIEDALLEAEHFGLEMPCQKKWIRQLSRL